ncbi:MAG: DUF1566 domain-containing protein [Rikenellaceae bacterium]|nr:DUF1566 domain-containing protein [Rikenellaceae bacterium]
MQLTPGTLLERGKYRIIKTLGRGGFGVTYLAEQVMAKRKVCIKEFFPKNYYKRDGDTGALTLSSDGFAESMNKFKAKFIKEAQTIATLNHANIIPIHDVFEENGTAYYVMDYIEGESLYDIVKHGGALTEADAVRYIRDTAAALEHIHARQIMHLDVKPGNIMVREEDRRAILIDFGLSKHYDATSGEATSTTPVGVSHGYAPMEQYQDGGVSTFSPETDIYSLGATLYFLVTGNVPPQATVVAEQRLPNLEGLSSNIRETIAKSMSYLRKDRPHTIKEFLALLDNKRPVAAVLAAESEKTKITQKPKIQPAVEQPKPKPKTYLERELEHEQKRSRWWLWCFLLLFIVVLCIPIKYLNPNGDNAKEVAKEGKRVEMSAEEVVTTPIESEPDVLGEQVEGEKVVTMDDPVKKPVSTEATTPVEAPSQPKAPLTAQQLLLPEVAASEGNRASGDGTGWAAPVKVPATSAPYKVGDLYNENGKQGVVFWVTDGGRHGKIVSLDETRAEWDLRVEMIDDNEYINGTETGANSYSDGKANTEKVMSRADSRYFQAFTWCRHKGADWYLPAFDELEAIFHNQSAINSTLAEYDAELRDNGYWSSTEYHEFFAWVVRMGNGHTGNYYKNYYGYVRAVSAF